MAGLGHAGDITVSDLVCDYVAQTPSFAAVHITSTVLVSGASHRRNSRQNGKSPKTRKLGKTGGGRPGSDRKHLTSPEVFLGAGV